MKVKNKEASLLMSLKDTNTRTHRNTTAHMVIINFSVRARGGGGVLFSVRFSLPPFSHSSGRTLWLSQLFPVTLLAACGPVNFVFRVSVTSPTGPFSPAFGHLLSVHGNIGDIPELTTEQITVLKVQQQQQQQNPELESCFKGELSSSSFILRLCFWSGEKKTAQSSTLSPVCLK